MNFPFDISLTDRVIITYLPDSHKFTASVRLIGAADGYGVYSSGATAEIALQRALESAEKPERWRKLKF